MRFPAQLLVVASLLALLLGGCGGVPCPAYPETHPADALALHRQTREHVHSLRAEARVDQRGKKRRIRGTAYMFVERPDKVRFDAMTQFGPAAILTSDGQRFALTDLRENRYLTGPTCPANIARLLGIPLSGAEVSRLLIGDTPRIQATGEHIECTGHGTYLVSLEGSDGARQQIELAVAKADRDLPPSQQHMRLVRSEVFDPNGKTKWRVTFSDYRLVADPLSKREGGKAHSVAMPFEIHFVEPASAADVLVKVQHVDLNVKPPAGTFEQTPRPGIALEYVPCQ